MAPTKASASRRIFRCRPIVVRNIALARISIPGTVILVLVLDSTTSDLVLWHVRSAAFSLSGRDDSLRGAGADSLESPPIPGLQGGTCAVPPGSIQPVDDA